MRTQGPREPDGFKAIRDAYWHQYMRRIKLEHRIQMTDAGLEFIMRVKQAGHHAHT